MSYDFSTPDVDLGDLDRRISALESGSVSGLSSSLRSNQDLVSSYGIKLEDSWTAINWKEVFKDQPVNSYGVRDGKFYLSVSAYIHYGNTYPRGLFQYMAYGNYEDMVSASRQIDKWSTYPSNRIGADITGWPRRDTDVSTGVCQSIAQFIWGAPDADYSDQTLKMNTHIRSAADYDKFILDIYGDNYQPAGIKVDAFWIQTPLIFRKKNVDWSPLWGNQHYAINWVNWDLKLRGTRESYFYLGEQYTDMRPPWNESYVSWGQIYNNDTFPPQKSLISSHAWNQGASGIVYQECAPSYRDKDVPKWHPFYDGRCGEVWHGDISVSYPNWIKDKLPQHWISN